jgi:hypothetical protein
MGAPLPSIAGGSVVISGEAIPLDTNMGVAFIADCSRYLEGVLTEDDVRSHWRLSAAEWAGIEANHQLQEAVQRALRQRVENGAAAQDLARFAYPEVIRALANMANGELLSPRHRIEAARELRAVAGVPKDAPGPADRVTIIISTGGDRPALKVIGEIPSEEVDADHRFGTRLLRSHG